MENVIELAPVVQPLAAHHIKAVFWLLILICFITQRNYIQVWSFFKTFPLFQWEIFSVISPYGFYTHIEVSILVSLYVSTHNHSLCGLPPYKKTPTRWKIFSQWTAVMRDTHVDGNESRNALQMSAIGSRINALWVRCVPVPWRHETRCQTQR